MRGVALASWLVLTSASCSLILGLDEAEYDASFEGSAAETHGGAGSSEGGEEAGAGGAGGS